MTPDLPGHDPSTWDALVRMDDDPDTTRGLCELAEVSIDEAIGQLKAMRGLVRALARSTSPARRAHVRATLRGYTGAVRSTVNGVLGSLARLESVPNRRPGE